MGAEGSRPTEVDPEEMAEKQREILRMDQIVRNKVRSGVQYNMKVILRGERGSGKTALWKRFQGLTFEDKVRVISLHIFTYFILKMYVIGVVPTHCRDTGKCNLLDDLLLHR